MPDPNLTAPKITEKPLLPNNEETKLSPLEEVLFRHWASGNGIKDVDDPEAHYDYRGFYKSTNGKIVPPGSHFPDTFKQHGHETFSTESQYSKGPMDGGIWIGPNHDHYLPQPSMEASHLALSATPAGKALIDRMK